MSSSISVPITSSLWALVRLEGRLLRGQGTVCALLLLLALAMPAALFWQQHQLARQQTLIASAAERAMAAWRNQSLKNAHTAAHFGTWVFRPPSPLQSLEPGLSAHVGVATLIDAHRRNGQTLAATETGQADASAPALSPALLAKTAFPLLMLVLGLLIGRREASRFDVDPLRVAGASAASTLSIQALVLMALALAALLPLALAAFGTGLSAASLWPWLLATLAVQVSFAWLGLCLGRLGGRARGAVVVALLFWVLVALALPRLAMTLAQVSAPTSRLAQDAALKAALAKEVDGHGNNEANQAFKRALLQRYGVSDEAQLPVNADAMLMQADEEARAKVFADEQQRLRDAFDRQDRAVDAQAWISPLMAYERLSMALAHTDRHALDEHADRVERHRLAMVGALNDDMARNTRTGDWSTPAARAVFTALPAPPALAFSPLASLQRAASAAWGLGAWVLLSAAALVFTARRARARSM
jgi:ABC-2 type transport system permease protein